MVTPDRRIFFDSITDRYVDDHWDVIIARAEADQREVDAGTKRGRRLQRKDRVLRRRGSLLDVVLVWWRGVRYPEERVIRYEQHRKNLIKILERYLVSQGSFTSERR